MKSGDVSLLRLMLKVVFIITGHPKIARHGLGRGCVVEKKTKTWQSNNVHHYLESYIFVGMTMKMIYLV